MNRFTLGERVFPSVRRFLPTVLCRLSDDRCATKVHPSEKGFTLVTFGQDMSVRRYRGFTLMELVAVLSIAAVLMALAVPTFTDMRVNSRISGLSGEMISHINTAKSRAIATRRPVYLVRGSGGGGNLTAGAGGWASGWRLVSNNAVLLQNDQKANSDGIVVAVTNGGVSAAGVTTGAALAVFGFNAQGRLIGSPTGVPPVPPQLAQVSIVICDSGRDGERGRTLQVSGLGRITTTVVQNPTTCVE